MPKENGAVLSPSRRALLASLSSFLLASAAGSNSSFLQPVSVGRSGRINLGLNGLGYQMSFDPLLNAWKAGGPIQVIRNGVSYWSNKTPGSPDSAWGTFLNKEGELINPLPANTT